MLANSYNQPEMLIDEARIAALAVDHVSVKDLRVANNAFKAALEVLKNEGEETMYFAASRYAFTQALAAVFDAGRVQGIREERAKKKAETCGK